MAEGRSVEQLQNGISTTSAPYWDTDDDDDDIEPKPSELYRKFTWKIDCFSRINKRELRGNQFEAGEHKWYILIYPRGYEASNHLALFLCVANHDKLYPGWSHLAQYTLSIVNKDPRKSKYNDTLHRFCKKEHDWGWRKCLELSELSDGFLEADTLIVTATVQVIRDRADRPFRCLECQHRRELAWVYLKHVEAIRSLFVEEKRGKIAKLVENRTRWSRFCAFWLKLDPETRQSMSRVNSGLILENLVDQFFSETDVVYTLVMDSLYSGLKVLEGQTKSKKGNEKCLDAEELLVPIVRIENNKFTVVDDVLLLLKKEASKNLLQEDDKDPQNPTMDGGPREDYTEDSIERVERRLTELGLGTIENFVLDQIFSKIELAYLESVALKMQEKLILEEEAAKKKKNNKKKTKKR